MNKNSSSDLSFFVQDASDSRVYEHIYLRGNHKQDMFHDKVDKINVWNRYWLSAKATGTEVVSMTLLDSHLHGNNRFKQERQDSKFMHHFRLSITQYYNNRYEVRGMLGTRRFGRAVLRDLEDLKDCICYHIRNILHHGISQDFLHYPFSTALFVFGLSKIDPATCYTVETLPPNLARAYLPAREKLPKGWLMTREGMIVPPPEVFRADIVEALFGSREEYLETLSHQTTREAGDPDRDGFRTDASDSRSVRADAKPSAIKQGLNCRGAKEEKTRSGLTLDEKVVAFVNENSRVPLGSMTDGQKMVAIRAVKEEFPMVSLRALSRIFGIPVTTLQYRFRTRRE